MVVNAVMSIRTNLKPPKHYQYRIAANDRLPTHEICEAEKQMTASSCIAVVHY